MAAFGFSEPPAPAATPPSREAPFGVTAPVTRFRGPPTIAVPREIEFEPEPTRLPDVFAVTVQPARVPRASLTVVLPRFWVSTVPTLTEPDSVTAAAGSVMLNAPPVRFTLTWVPALAAAGTSAARPAVLRAAMARTRDLRMVPPVAMGAQGG